MVAAGTIVILVISSAFVSVAVAGIRASPRITAATQYVLQRRHNIVNTSCVSLSLAITADAINAFPVSRIVDVIDRISSILQIFTFKTCCPPQHVRRVGIGLSMLPTEIFIVSIQNFLL